MVALTLFVVTKDIHSVTIQLDTNQYDKLKELSGNNFRSVNDTSKMMVIKYLEEVK